jgi:hypothetical protein
MMSLSESGFDPYILEIFVTIQYLRDMKLDEDIFVIPNNNIIEVCLSDLNASIIIYSERWLTMARK